MSVNFKQDGVSWEKKLWLLLTRKLTPNPSYSIGGVKMADQGAADPGNNNNNNKPEASEGTIIKVTVKTPKDKEEIAIAEDASVTQVRGSLQS